MRKWIRESGFATYVTRALRSDPQARMLFLAEIMKEPTTTQIRLLRRFRGLTQLALARRVKVVQLVLARLERLGSNPRVRTLERVARGLDARLELVSQTAMSFLAAVQLRAQGEIYFRRIAGMSKGSR